MIKERVSFYSKRTKIHEFVERKLENIQGSIKFEIRGISKVVCYFYEIVV